MAFHFGTVANGVDILDIGSQVSVRFNATSALNACVSRKLRSGANTYCRQYGVGFDGFAVIKGNGIAALGSVDVRCQWPEMEACAFFF